jgi:uncharacterized membrane protein YGL010W
MQSLKYYLDVYSSSHINSVNIKIHNVCVPAIMWSLPAFFSSFMIMSPINAGHLFIVGCLFYYTLFRNVRLFAAMFLVSSFILISAALVPEVRITAIVVFVVAWIGQFYGHKIEGKKPSFLQDVSYLLIGPVWVIEKLFPKFLYV